MSDRISFAGTMTAEGRRLKGFVQLDGSRTLRNGEYVEVDPAALIRANRKDVFARVDHDPAKVIGRTLNDTLTLSLTDQGIAYETADLPNTTYANDALELARGGYFGGSSFEIEGLKFAHSRAEDGLPVRRITSIKRLIDVSPVLDPAFPSTTAAFSNERKDMDENPQPAPQPDPPKPAPEPPAQFSQTSSDFETAYRFAQTQELSSIENALENIMEISGGNMTAAQEVQYKAFARAYDERKAVSVEAQRRKDQLDFEHKVRLGKLTQRAPEAEVFASDDYAHAFVQYLKSTPQNFSANTARMESFAQTIAGDGSQGGFTVPDGFIAKVVERLKAFGGIAELAEEITTSTGESLRWVSIDDTANKAQIVAEDTQATTGADLVFDGIELGAFEYDATGASGNPIEVSLSLLQDSAFDLESLLTRLLGKRIGRKQADNWATGTGVNEPVGLFSKGLDTMSATATSLAAPEHILQVDSEYRDGGNARWVMSDTSLAKVWTAQTTTNAPMFLPGGTINGKPYNTLYGYPIKIDPAAGNLVAFGDINQGYIIRRVRGVQLLVDPYTAQKRRAVQYHAWARADGNIQDPNAYSVSDWSTVSADT